MTTDHNQPQPITNAQFEETQLQWLCQSIENELSWQAAELFIKQIWGGNNVDRLIEQFQNLEKYGFTIDGDLLLELWDQFDGEDTNIFRRPEVFKTSLPNFEKAHNGIKRLEQKFETRPNSRLKWLGMPVQPAQFRRANITSTAYVLLDVIKEQYKIRYGRGFSHKFKGFVRSRILANADLSRFLFRGKVVGERNQSENGVDPYDTFTSVRNTARRRYSNARRASPMYRQSFERLSKIHGVIMRPPIVC